MLVKYFLKTILLKLSFILISFLALNGCGGGGSVTSNVASGGPISMDYLVSRPWGINNTGIIRIQDRLTNTLTNTLTYSDNVSETLKGDGTYNNPNDYEVVSIISESLDNYGVATIEVVARYKVTGETANIIIKGYSDALILDVVSNSNSPSSASGTQVGGSKVSYMPIGTYTYRG